MSPRKLCITLIVLFTLVSTRVLADPLPSHTRITTDGVEVVTPNGKRYPLPVGSHILDGTSFEKLDLEMKRLQDAETRYTAENKSLKDSLQASPQIGWGAAGLLVAFMAVCGGVVYFSTN